MWRTLLLPCLLMAMMGCTSLPQRGEPSPRSHRLFSGAPPVIPHSVEGRGECLVCHLEGLEVDVDERAPQTAHPHLHSCRQCHVTQTTIAVWRSSSFSGLSAYPEGARRYPDTPPTIPHAIRLHENCLACHGEAGPRDVINTPHLDRASCRQCHIMSIVSPFQ